MKKQFLSLMMLLPTLSVAHEATVSSPDGRLVVTINDDGGQPTYAITLDGRQALLPSPLGFKADVGDFSRRLSIKRESRQTVSKSYDMWQTKQRHYSYEANQLKLDVENAASQAASIVFQVSNNNVAFRYELPRQKGDNPKCALVSEETTGFCLPEGTTTFLTPQIDPMKGWERTKPSYEEEYKPDAPMAQKSQYGQGYTFPCLFKATTPSVDGSKASGAKDEAAALWILISETGVTSQYCGSHLSDYRTVRTQADDGRKALGYAIAYPQAGENNGFGSTGASIALPGVTPWRTVTVGTTLKPIVETTIAYDVVDPLYEPSVAYTPGRYTWSWLIWQDESINYDDQVRFIDLAAAMNYEYCLVDNWWDKNIGRERIALLSQYAQQKGVSLMLWYNSNGHWNDAPQTPRNCMDTNIARDREMAWLKKIGVKGIKVDFFAGDKQATMKLYEDILYDANRYGLQVVFHGCTLPRGWERIYPNFVSSEAVLASENVFFSDYHAQQEPFQLTMHPFCRNAVATMDWGGVIMNKYLSKDNKSRHQRQTTDGFELATAFTNQAAVQCVAMQPNNLDELPQAELDFLRRLPTSWDETRFVDGYPGRYVVLARRHGDQWYVAALNGTDQPLKLTLALPMFAAGSKLSVMTDATGKKSQPTGTAVCKSVKTDKRGFAQLQLLPRGGAVIFNP